MSATAHVANKRTPGKLVRDAGTFHQLMDGSNVTASGNTGWQDKGMIKECQAHLEIGAVSGTSPTLDLEIQIADDDSGNGSEVIAIFGRVGDNDNTEAKIEKLCIDKRYVRAVYVVGGSSPVFPATLTLRTAMDHYNDARSADVS